MRSSLGDCAMRPVFPDDIEYLDAQESSVLRERDGFADIRWCANRAAALVFDLIGASEAVEPAGAGREATHKEFMTYRAGSVDFLSDIYDDVFIPGT